MKALLNRLHSHERLSKTESYQLLIDMLSGTYLPEQIAAILSAYQMRPISAEELQGFRQAMLEKAELISFEQENRIDIVGTGGDGKNSFNISTLSCFVVAGAGCFVTKHGNYGVSSVSGSSNVLEHLGYRFTNDSTVLQQQLEKARICFLHAPLFHPAMKVVAPIRKALGVRTIFNILGPICNPSRPSHYLIGVSREEIGELYHEVLSEENDSYTIVHALDGFDEISLTSDTIVWKSMSKKQLTPRDFQARKWDEKDLNGGKTVKEAADIFYHILTGNGTEAQIDVICANAGMAISMLKPELSLSDSILEARDSLLSGKALQSFKKLIDL